MISSLIYGWGNICGEVDSLLVKISSSIFRYRAFANVEVFIESHDFGEVLTRFKINLGLSIRMTGNTSVGSSLVQLQDCEIL